MRLAAFASSALLAGCSAISAQSGGLADPIGPAPRPSIERTLSYRIDSFTDPTFDISPDGQHLYFAAMGEIYVVPISGGLAKPLRLGAGWKMRPAISPDGLSIAFLSDRGGGITAWRSPLSLDRPATGDTVSGFEAMTLAWADKDSLVSAGGSTRGVSGTGLTVDYEGAHGNTHRSGQADPEMAPASMSADRHGNFFLHRVKGIVRIDADTGIEDMIVPASADPVIGQPRVTWDGSWLGFVSTSGGVARLVLRNLATGESRVTGCRLNPVQGSALNYGANPEPSYAFIPGQQAVVLERDGRFHKCTFDGVETSIPVEADVALDIAPRIRPSLTQIDASVGLPQNLASTTEGGIVAFSSAGHLWVQRRATGQARRASASDAQELMPAFSADARHLAYVERFQDESSSLRVLDLETGASSVLLHSRNILANPAWSSDGRRIAFVETPVSASTKVDLRWLGTDGSSGDIGQVAMEGSEPFPTLTWDSSGSGILYTQGRSTLMSLRLGGTPQRLLSADSRVWGIRVSPSRRFASLQTRDAIYVTPILLSNRDHPDFSWPEVRAMKRLWTGGSDHAQWLPDDSLIWTVQHKLMRAAPGEEPREIADLRVPAEAEAKPERHAYVGATAISMDRAGTIADAVIVTNGPTLEYVGARDGAPDLTGVETTDLSGKWVVPGFVDVHSHNSGTELSEYNLPVSQYNLAELGYGVTTLFDPSGRASVESSIAWGMSQRDEFVGPTLYGTGPILLGFSGSFLTVDVESYEQVRVLASDMARRGGLMLKDYRQGDRQQREWIGQAARASGLGVTSDEDMAPAVNIPLILSGYTAVEHVISEGALREDIKRLLIETRIPLTPTLVVPAEDRGFLRELDSPDPRRACLVNPSDLHFGAPVDPKQLLGSPIGVQLTDYADLLNRGAKVAIGGHGAAPGLDFHWELALLSIGGATPMNLLRAATMNGAEKLGLDGRIGSLVRGKDADFVVLNANPLDDIRNARNIERVVRRGRLVAWPAGAAPQSWKSVTAWNDCQRWNFGLGRSDTRVAN